MKNIIKLTLLSFVLFAPNALQTKEATTVMSIYINNKSGNTAYVHATYRDGKSKNDQLENSKSLKLDSTPSELVINTKDVTESYSRLTSHLIVNGKSMGTLEIRKGDVVAAYIGSPR